MRWIVLCLLGFLAFLVTHPVAAAVLRKKSGRAIILGFSRTELESYGVGQYVVIENFEKNQWTGLIKKIYRVNRVRITLIDDDSEEMEVGETFRIKPGEAPRSVARPEFDPTEFHLKDDETIPATPGKDDGPVPNAAPAERPQVQEASEQDRLLLAVGLVTRYYIVPAGKLEGDLHGTGTQLQGTFLMQSGWGFHLGLRKEDLVYSGFDQFSEYNVSVLMYFTGASYTWHFLRWSVSSGLRYILQAKGSGTLKDTLVNEGKPISFIVRGVGELRETDMVVHGSYDWEYVSLFAEASLSISARYSSRYRYQLSADGPNGSELIDEYRTQYSYPMQVEGFSIGISLSL